MRSNRVIALYNIQIQAKIWITIRNNNNHNQKVRNVSCHLIVLNSFNFLEIIFHNENTAKINNNAKQYKTSVLNIKGTAEKSVNRFH